MSTCSESSESGTTELVLTSKAEPQLVSSFASESANLETQQNLLLVINESTPDEAVASIRTAFDTEPAEFGIISLGEETRSTTADPSMRSTPATIMAVARTDDFTRLGTVTNLYLNEWADNPHQTRIYFSPLTELVDQGPLRQVFRFIHLLSHRIRTTGAVVKLYLDPQTCSSRTIKMLEPLFDVVTDQRDTNARSTHPSDPSLEPMVTDVLDTQRCRQVITYLLKENTPVKVSTIAEWIVKQDSQDGGDDSDSVDHLHQELYHVHIPRLVEAGLVVTDGSHDQVEETRTLKQAASELSLIDRE